jgi:hypothetical protein
MSAQVQAWLKRDGRKIVLCRFALGESPPARLLRLHLDQLDVGQEGQGRRDHQRSDAEPNAEVGAIHPKAMPLILTTPDEVEIWMTALADEALKLQRPLPDGTLRIVARGAKKDQAAT